MNRMSEEKRAQVVAALVEGNSIRSTCRMTGCSKNSVIKLLADLGTVCAAYQSQAFRDLSCKRFQIDECWAFCYCKQKNLSSEKQGRFGYGDVWTFAAICDKSKLVPSWRIGTRDSITAGEFVQDLVNRLKNRVQITTDGHTMYLEAIEKAFGAGVDYAVLQKLYGSDPEAEKRYSPAQCIGTRRASIQGNPAREYVSTSYVERMNLTLRMGQRRYTRLTNGFSKKVENLAYSLAIFLMYYNFVRIHQSLRITPAMAAGVTNRLWSIKDMVALLELEERKEIEMGALKRGRYKKRAS